MTNFEKVLEFHKTFNQDINSEPTKDLVILRLNLITEEVDEVEEELYNWDAPGLVSEKKPEQVDKEKLTKELADLLYVVYGMGVAFGLPLDEAFAEVHRSNMSKLDKDGKPIYREDGKVLKSENYSPADMSKLEFMKL